VQQEATHVTADGRRLLVLHGDRCDLTPHGAHASLSVMRRSSTHASRSHSPLTPVALQCARI
jgi:UDP-2,3-diacylglucosamine pyrophosphatase LpxH